MRDSTRTALKELRDAPLLSKVGTTPHEPRVVWIGNWYDAVALLEGSRWTDLTLRVREWYREQLMRRSIERWRRWNDVIGELKPLVDELVQTRICPSLPVRGGAMESAVAAAVRWDLVHLLVECEHDDVLPPSFFLGQGYFYIEGHLPCGWDGPDPPGGRAIVF